MERGWPPPLMQLHGQGGVSVCACVCRVRRRHGGRLYRARLLTSKGVRWCGEGATLRTNGPAQHAICDKGMLA